MNWGYKITIAALAFMGYIIFLVSKCMEQDVDLVDKHYYKEEIEYQAQIEKLRNAGEEGRISINHQAGAKKIAFQFRTDETGSLKGTIRFFRPSDKRLDKTFPIQLDQTKTQQISTASLLPGLWKLKVSWTDGAKEFFREETLVL